MLTSDSLTFISKHLLALLPKSPYGMISDSQRNIIITTMVISLVDVDLKHSTHFRLEPVHAINGTSFTRKRIALR